MEATTFFAALKSMAVYMHSDNCMEPASYELAWRELANEAKNTYPQVFDDEELERIHKMDN